MDSPSRTVKHRITGKCDCGNNLKSIKVVELDRRQVFDIPEINIEVTEHQAEIKECPDCGKLHTADFPVEVKQKAQYGNRIKALAIHLKSYGFMSYERLGETLSDLTGISISQGTLVNWINESASKIEPVVEKIKDELINSGIVHFDETGIRINGKLHWLHIASNTNLTYYFPHKRRGKEAMDAIGILPEFKGIAIHDHWKAYYEYLCLHGLCNAHHLRELTFFEEEGRPWASKIIKCLLDAKEEKEKSNKHFDLKRIQYYKSRLKRILNEGLKQHPKNTKKTGKRGRPKQSDEYNLLARLKEYIDDVLHFIYNLKVPFDNNLGERDARMAKVQQKISGTFRSFKGAISFCNIRSYISSMRKCGQSVFNSLQSIFQNHILQPEVIVTAE